ncbi:MAG: NifU family protein [Schleiferiaceae bacterium]|nr:NifU family protein [Schleiferiaceae bacterium]
MELKRVPVSVYAEMTPNPAVMKFVANKMLVQVDSIEFKNIDEATPSPLAQKLFHFPFVKEVFLSGNYVSISKYNIVEWEEVTQEIRQFITDFISGGGVVLDESKLSASASDDQTDAATSPAETFDNLGEVEKRIVEILEEYVKPAVAQDGGNIKFIGYANKVVSVQLQGACSGCPSSTMTLKSGILNLMKSMLPTLVEDVEAVNG